MSNTHSFTLKDGRAVTIRKIRGALRMQLLRVLGPDNSQIPLYAGQAFTAMTVSSLDGIPYPPPVNLAQIEAMIDRLDDDNATLEQIALAYGEAFKEPEVTTDEVKAVAKN